MSGQNRTFVLQVAGVATLVAVIFFAFLRPSDPGELSGIDAPGGNPPAFELPGVNGGNGPGRARADGESRRAIREGAGGRHAFASSAGWSAGLGVPPFGDSPSGEQYTSTAVALMERVKAASPGGAR